MKFGIFVLPSWPQRDPSHQGRIFHEMAERTQSLRYRHNVQYFGAHFSYGSLEHGKVMRAMELFAKEVMPKFR